MSDSSAEVRFLGDVQRLELRPGDVVVLSLDAPVTDQTADLLKRRMETAIPGHQCLIMAAGMKLGVLARES